jgi:predicted Zn-dependent protease
MFSDDMKFHVVNSSTINAFTTGGEHMYIYSALIEQCADEDELAAVMAHEYAHVFGRHVQASTDRQTAIGLGAAGAGYIGQEVGGDSGSTYSTAFTTAVALGGQFLGMGYTRAQEDEADKFGFAFYTHAGWDPQQFAGFFKKMIQAGADSTPALLSDHPTLASRVEATDRRISELPKNASQWRRPPVKNPQEFAQFKQRVKQVGANMPDDKSLEEAQTLLAAFASCISPAREPSRDKARAEIAESVEQQKAAQTR